MTLSHADVVLAFVRGEEASHYTTRTDGHCLYYQERPIAWKIGKGYRLTLAGHNTRSTRERLNTLLRQIRCPYRVGLAGRQAYIFGRCEKAPLLPLDEIALEEPRKKRPAIKGKHKGIWSCDN